MSDSDSGTSTGSAPYESEDDMICYITGRTKPASGHPDLPDASRLSEGSLHSRQMLTEPRIMAWASVPADGALGTDTNSQYNNSSVSASDVLPAISAEVSCSVDNTYTMRQSNMRTADREVRNQLSVASDYDVLGIDPSIRRRLTKSLSGTKAQYQVSEAPADKGQSNDRYLGRSATDTGSESSTDSGMGSEYY